MGTMPEEVLVRQCVGSGHCCKQAPCPFGASISDKVRQCKFLEVQEVLDERTTIYRCGRYEEIKNLPGANVAPAFGAGCCQPLFNSNRAAILTILGQRNRNSVVGGR